jgi:ABC-2 type transport system permease protein
MIRGLLKLTWVETKVFIREPLGLFGTIVMPVLIFLVLGRIFAARARVVAAPAALLSVELPVFAAILMTISAIVSLVTIVSIYREGGILKRLRATPLRPQTILTAHVLVKIGLTLATLALMVLAGRRYYPAGLEGPILRFTAALIVSTISLLSIGFLVASIVPTARFAQPIATLLLYPMVAVSGLFVPIDAMPPAVQSVARFVPFTYAVSLLKGAWTGEPWSAHITDIAALAIVFVICSALSARVFRWE